MADRRQPDDGDVQNACAEFPRRCNARRSPATLADAELKLRSQI
jgi:hypothetical protein